jgi:hypothetical protein
MSILQSWKSSQSLYPPNHTFRVDLRPPSRHRLSRLPAGAVTAPRKAQVLLRHCRRFRDRTWLGKRSRGHPSNPVEVTRYCATLKV